MGEVLARQATLLERVERFADAEVLRKRSLTIAGNIQGKQHPIYADRLALLSVNALAQGKVDQAFAQIGEATQILIERNQARSEAHTSIEAKRTSR